MTSKTDTVETTQPAAELKVVHWDAHQHEDLLAFPHEYYCPEMEDLFPKEVLDLLSKETNGDFDPVEDSPLPRAKTREEQEAIGTGAAKCPFCKNGQVYRLHQGRETGIKVLWPVRCYCLVYKKYFSRWNDPRYIAALFRMRRPRTS